MKKGYLLPLALLGLMYLPSCQQEVEPVTPEDEPVPEGCYFRAYPETPEDESRTYISEKDEYNKQHVIWRVGEKLQVINGTGDVCANFESMDNAQKALFYYEGTDFAMTAPYYSIYPATATITTSTCSYSVSATQACPAGTFADGTNVTLGCAGENKRLRMVNLNAYVSFTISATDLIDKAILSADQNIAGTVSQAFTASGTPLSINLGAKSITSGSPTITLTPASGTYFANGSTYYVAMIPGSYTNVKLTLYNGERKVSERKREDTFSAERSKIKNLGDVTPSDVAVALLKSSMVKDVSRVSRRKLANGVQYYHAETTSVVSDQNVTPEAPGPVDYHILEIQLSENPSFDFRCSLPYDAPTPWVTTLPSTTTSTSYDSEEAWDTQSILDGRWVDAVNAGDEHVVAMFPGTDYHTTAKVPTFQVHSRGQVLRTAAYATNRGVYSVYRDENSVVSKLVDIPHASYSTCSAAPATYSDLFGFTKRVINSGGPVMTLTGYSKGPSAVIGYVGTGDYSKIYYVMASDGYPYIIGHLMKGLGCNIAAIQHPGPMSELILENSGKTGYECKGNASEAATQVMTAWALVVKKTFRPTFIAGSQYLAGLVDGTGRDNIRINRAHGICWSGTSGVAYFTQRSAGTQAVRKVTLGSVTTTSVTTMISNTSASPTTGELNGPYGCCAYKMPDGVSGVLVANRNGGASPYKLVFVRDSDNASCFVKTVGVANNCIDVKVDGVGAIWVAAPNRISKGAITGTWPDYEYYYSTNIDVSTVDSGAGSFPASLAFDAEGNTLYGTWVAGVDSTSVGNIANRPGIYFIPSGATDASGIVRVAGDATTEYGSSLGTPGNLLTATFPVVSGLYYGKKDHCLYIACGFRNGATVTTNSVRKLIPVNKSPITADSYIKGRMISINDATVAGVAAAGIIVNDDCTEAYVADFLHRILKIQINTPSY